VVLAAHLTVLHEGSVLHSTLPVMSSQYVPLGHVALAQVCLGTSASATGQAMAGQALPLGSHSPQL
jgi:hypothetical protein